MKHKAGQLAKSYDPTNTTRYVNAWIRENCRKVATLRKEIQAEAEALLRDCGDEVPKTNAAGGRRPYRYRTSPEKFGRFRAWLDSRMRSGMLDVLDELNPLPVFKGAWWAGKHIASAYKRGMTRAVDEMKKAGAKGYANIQPIETTAPALYGTADYDKGLALRQGARDYKLPDGNYASLTAAFNTPINADRVVLLYARTFEGMRGLSDTMKTSLSGLLAQGMADGKNPYDIAKVIDKTMNIGLARANMIARTEIIRAHHHGAINTYRNAGVHGVKTMAELVTVSGDVGNFEEMGVCEKCMELQIQTAAEPLSLDEALPLIPVHPNCRCMVIPVITDIEG